MFTRRLLIIVVLGACRRQFDDGNGGDQNQNQNQNQNVNINAGGTYTQTSAGGVSVSTVSVVAGWNLRTECRQNVCTVFCCPANGGSCHLHQNGRGCPSN